MTNRVFVDRYQVTEKIGTGGMAEVYKATDKVLGRTVAVKTMLPQYASDSTFAARFRQEAQAAANLSSPYIVNIYDWGKDGDTYFIVMEYIRGIDLKSAIKQRGTINQRKAAEIGMQICSALAVAHEYDVIHRDIKPQNIMIQPDGNAKVMDFGIARAGNSDLTQTNSVLGTAHYVSPEQAQGKPLGPQSDLYSLGIVLYESITGKLPFEGPDAVSVAVKQVKDTPALPSEINPDVDPTLEAIIMHVLQKNPDDRFCNAADMRTALANWLAGRPVKLTSNNAEPVELLPGIGVAAVEGPTVKMSGAGEGATQVMNPQSADGTQVIVRPQGMGSGSVGQTQKPPEHIDYRKRDVPAEKPKNRKPFIIIAVIVAALLVAGIAFAARSCSQDGLPTVPDVTGMTQTKATSLLTHDGFVVGEVHQENSATVAAGNVIRQSPKGGSQAEAGSSVDLWVSLGPAAKQVSVPDLSNKTEAEAQEALTAAGLSFKAGTAEFSDTIGEGHVISQNPLAGATVEQGTAVTYVLSKGPETFDVPNVAGYGQGDAVSALNNAGFTAEISDRVHSDSVPEGCVVSYSPTNAKKGDTVYLVISSGPEPAPTVYVDGVLSVGMTHDQAASALSGAGLGFAASGDTSGTVSGWSPDGEQPVGTTITVYFTAPSGGNDGGGDAGAGTNDAGTEPDAQPAE